jgi:hypothetical protein
MAPIEEILDEDPRPKQNLIERVAAWFGIGDLDFYLSPANYRRFVYASAVPALALLLQLVRLLVDIFDSNVASLGFEPTIQQRVYFFIGAIDSQVLALAVAFLFLYSIHPVSRAVGSWAFAAALVCASAAIALSLLGAIPLTLSDPDFLGSDEWYSGYWLTFSYQFAFLTIGYAFMAYRGLNRASLPKARRTYIPPRKPLGD